MPRARHQVVLLAVILTSGFAAASTSPVKQIIVVSKSPAARSAAEWLSAQVRMSTGRALPVRSLPMVPAHGPEFVSIELGTAEAASGRDHDGFAVWRHAHDDRIIAFDGAGCRYGAAAYLEHALGTSFLAPGAGWVCRTRHRALEPLSVNAAVVPAIEWRGLQMDMFPTAKWLTWMQNVGLNLLAVSAPVTPGQRRQASEYDIVVWSNGDWRNFDGQSWDHPKPVPNSWICRQHGPDDPSCAPEHALSPTLETWLDNMPYTVLEVPGPTQSLFSPDIARIQRTVDWVRRYRVDGLLLHVDPYHADPLLLTLYADYTWDAELDFDAQVHRFFGLAFGDLAPLLRETFRPDQDAAETPDGRSPAAAQQRYEERAAKALPALDAALRKISDEGLRTRLTAAREALSQLR